MILTLYMGSDAFNQSVAFCRLNPVGVLQKGLNKSEPQWYQLKRDRSFAAVSSTGYPGAVSLRIGFITSEEVVGIPYTSVLAF